MVMTQLWINRCIIIKKLADISIRNHARVERNSSRASSSRRSRSHILILRNQTNGRDVTNNACALFPDGCCCVGVAPCFSVSNFTCSSPEHDRCCHCRMTIKPLVNGFSRMLLCKCCISPSVIIIIKDQAVKCVILYCVTYLVL